MGKYLFIVALMTMCISLNGQELILGTNVGVGNYFQNRHGQGKSFLSLNAGVLLSQKYHLSLEAAFGGDLFPNADNFSQPSQDFAEINSSTAKFNYLTANVRIDLWKKNGNVIFSGVNLGMAKLYINGLESLDIENLKNTNLALAIDLGTQIADIGIFLRFQDLGKLSSFNIEHDTLTITSTERKFQAWFLCLNYRFWKSKL